MWSILNKSYMTLRIGPFIEVKNTEVDLIGKYFNKIFKEFLMIK